MKQKSFINNMLNFVFHHRKKETVKNMTPAKAIAAQKEYIARKCEADTPYSEPYIEIAKQLFDPRYEIFDAAVYYLEKIALIHHETAEPILAVLENFAAEAKREEDKQARLNEAIQKITEKYNL